ncbi:MAG: hypothetical protein AB4372_37425, partial [Xenococcus sp. (in: cyanobacteria)]
MSCLWSTVTFSQVGSPKVVSDVSSLLQAVNNGQEGDKILITNGTYELQQPLEPKSGMSIRGMGDRTIITAASTWQPSVEQLPKIEDPHAYLFSLQKVTNVTLSQMKLTGNKLHGAIYANKSNGLELHHLQIRDFLWSSVRTFHMNNLKVHDNVFVDAGGKYRWVGGALYLDWTKNSEFWNNRIYRSADNKRKFFGFKGRGGANLRFHHNDVQVNFSLEFPFENDRAIEIDHNNFAGVISIPKQKGGFVLEEDLTYHIHHNWFHKSYSLEWARNSVEVDHNFFDFETEDDGGNLISNHGSKLAPGPTFFHDNLIKNPGLGLFWSKGVYNQFYFYNNYVKANILTQSDGFFGFNPSSDFNTIEIKDNIIENITENPRPLMRNVKSYAAIIENNTLENISDTSAYINLDTGSPRGPL